MIKAIIFDCFGVLTSDGWLPFRQKYFGSQPDLLNQATAINKATDAGLLSYHGFITKIAEMADVTPDTVRQEIERNVANTPLFDIIQHELKPRYKIGMLSNAAQNWLPRLFEPNQIALFDAIALSCDIGAIKPDPRTYQAIMDRLGVVADECIFVDDQINYCTGAQRIGMQGPSITPTLTMPYDSYTNSL